MWITVNFTHSEQPATGLTPEIRIRSVETGDVVASGVMNEVGDGFYTYKFTGYDITKDYYIVADSITLVGEDRYVVGVTGEYGPNINTIYVLSDNIDYRTALIRKVLINRLELLDGNTDNWVLYDDDDVTPLIEWDVSDKDGDVIEQTRYTDSRRTRGQ
jgi:hypothetical protein